MNRGAVVGEIKRDARRVDREDVDDAQDEMVEDPLDREVGEEGVRELAEDVREPLFDHGHGPHPRVISAGSRRLATREPDITPDDPVL